MRARLSRRDFLKSSGALIVSFSMAPLREPRTAQGQFGTRVSHIDPARLDSWLAVGADGIVTAYTGKCDLGQGMYTAQTQLIAEELCMPLDRIRLIQCDTSRTPDQGTTSGSQSTPVNFNTSGLAQAAATAREALLRMAAQRLGTVVDLLAVANGVISLNGKPGASVSYGELIGGKRFNLTLSATAKRRPENEWTVMGKPIPSLDITALATGQFEFVHNIYLPGMLHGRVARPPAAGATVVSVDESSVRDVPGLVKVVVRKNFIGVVAEK
ncbi:MAG: molybdopterin cofactor-binding domain-containing protein, partial [Blastocatellia bacterium]